ncbi:hypothetical protein PIB30_100096, partial [Stylosanthes scabra]|nr:hypothetical protein [Stylosanthes scabra]
LGLSGYVMVSRVVYGDSDGNDDGDVDDDDDYRERQWLFQFQIWKTMERVGRFRYCG